MIKELKVLFVTGNFLPGKNGGIENYVFWLAGILKEQNINVEVAALQVQEKAGYVYKNIPVHYLNENLELFESLLENKNYDICHFHEYSEYGGVEIPWFKKAKEHCNKVFFTFHLPYLTCYKNDFRYMGVEDCNTFNDPARCAECILIEKMNRVIGSGFGRAGTNILLHVPGVKSKLERRVATKRSYLKELIATCDAVFIIADWFKKLLFDNGYSQPNIHKIPNKPESNIFGAQLAENTTLKNRILFIGRIQQQKGLHLLCKAMNLLEDKNLQLDVYGNKVEEEYFDTCFQEYAFNYKGTVSREDLMAQISNYDFLVLPSVFTEMYPLVIIDAFHKNLPVIASAAKGNKDVVRDGANGFLFEYNNAKDLAMVIKKAYHLKSEGWKLAFEGNLHSVNDLREILSYYTEEQN